MLPFYGCALRIVVSEVDCNQLTIFGASIVNQSPLSSQRNNCAVGEGEISLNHSTSVSLVNNLRAATPNPRQHVLSSVAFMRRL
jgi:hypothetical protein